MTRENFLSAASHCLFAVLIIALFYNQAVRYFYYADLSKNNSVRIIPIDGPRGNIFDRNGKMVVSNRLSFDVAIVWQELKERTKLVNLLSSTLDRPEAEIARSLEKARSMRYAPVTVIEDIDKEKALALEEASLDIDGLMIETRSRRNYIYAQAASHIFGYLSEVTEDELEELRDYGYKPGDLLGRTGLEKYYDAYLTGVDGGTQVQVDSKGRRRKVLGLKEPSSGKDIYLTIDIDLQNACDRLLGPSPGAVIAMDPKTGQILALSSHPAFDPNVFVTANTSAARIKLLRDRSGRPLSNKAISGLYAPGSVFKIVTASAGLETKRINENTHFTCTGSYRLGNAKFDCWKEGGHGSQEVTAGLMNSCNVFFYNTGRVTGVDNIEAYTKLFGFGKLTGLDLPDEIKGSVPGRLWKRLHRNDNWYEGETLNYAIGQGYLAVTPIQVLDMMAVIANNGSLVKPFLVKKIDRAGVGAPKQKTLGLRERTIRKIREGLYKVVNDENGTGKRARAEGVAVAGKTGTAQNPQGKTHAWFSGFAPFNDPKICIVVFLEHGGKGGLDAAEMAGGIFKVAKEKGYI